MDTKKQTFTNKSKSPSIDYFISEGNLFEWNRDSHRLSIETKNYPILSKVKGINHLVTEGNELGILTIDSTLLYQYQGQLLDIGRADKLIGIINSSLVYTRNDSLFFYDPVNKINSYQKQNHEVKYAILRKDKKGNSLLGTSHNARRYYQFTLHTSEDQSDYSEIAKPINTIRDFYSDDFTKEILISTYNGLIYQSFSKYIDKYIYDSSLNSSEFGKVIWWVIERETTGDIYFANETRGFNKITSDSFEVVNPYHSSQKSTYTANYFGTYHSGSDKLYSFSLHRDHTTLHIWDFVNDPIDIDIPGRYYHLSTVDDRYLDIGGKNDTLTQHLIFDTQENRISSELNVKGIGKMIFHVCRHKGNYFYATDSGLYKFDKTHDKMDTLSKDYSFAVVSTGPSLIVGTDEHGLQIYKNDRLTSTINTTDGLPDNMVHSLNLDKDNNIWVSTNKGISVLDSNCNIIKNIRLEDGLTTSELNTKALLCTDSKVYAGSINGLNAIDLDILTIKDAYPLVINQVSITDKNGLESFKNVTGHQAINVEYGVDSLNLLFKNYKLFRSYFDHDYLFQNNLSTDGEQLTLNQYRLPINLKSTNLKVEQFLTHQNHSELSGIEITRQSFLKKYGPSIIMALLILALLISLYLLNRKRILDNQKEQVKSLTNKLDAMRASALRAQMNPHFIFNALGAIQYYIQRQDTEKAEEYLSDFSVLMRSTLESSKEDYTKINKEIEMLSLYLKLEHLRFEQKFEYIINVDDEIDQTLDIPSMTIQPFIENAINHGIYHLKDRKGIITIDLYEDEDEKIICKLTDNGIGRKASKQYRKKHHKSRALDNIDERLSIMNSLKNNNLAIKVTDKIVDNQIQGTVVTIQFGIKAA